MALGLAGAGWVRQEGLNLHCQATFLEHDALRQEVHGQLEGQNETFKTLKNQTTETRQRRNLVPRRLWGAAWDERREASWHNGSRSGPENS